MARPINEFREERYMSVNAFVEFLDILIHTFYEIMHGKRPRLTTMRRIAEKLGGYILPTLPSLRPRLEMRMIGRGEERKIMSDEVRDMAADMAASVAPPSRRP